MDELENDQDGFNAVYMMIHSGARGSKEQARQLGGMRGLMIKMQKNLQGSVGGIIEHPILANFKEGLDVIEYFISSHGGRKGLADTALKTSDAGHLTRKLKGVAQNVIVVEQCCNTLRGIEAMQLEEEDGVIESISDQILGKVALKDVLHPVTKQLIVASGEEINEIIAKAIDDSCIPMVEIRSVLTC